VENNEQKLHLWIPEQEITSVDKKPTGRGNDYGVDHAIHGNGLLKGLQSILDLFHRLKSSDSLHEEDLITFQVILQEKEDFANSKRLIEDEGLKINAVRDKRHAIVSASNDVFGNLRRRVDRYRSDGTKKDFQLIEGFAPFTKDEKKANSLVKYYKEHPEELTVDVQMMLLPEMEISMQERVQEKVTKRISNLNGHLEGEPYHLSDGTSIIRATISVNLLDELSDDSGIYRIEKTSFFKNKVPNNIGQFPQKLQISTKIDIDKLPTVVVLDDGVNFPMDLDSLVPVHWQATGCTKSKIFGNHGTPVASRVAFEELGIHIGDTYLEPRARIIDAQIVDSEFTPCNIMIQRIQEAVKSFAPVAKIFNFSYNAVTPIDGSQMSIIGCEMDMLCRKYHIKFVISAGNHKLVFSEDNLKDIIEDDESRIAEPADAMLGITVGSVVGITHKGSVSKNNEIAPYSRKGPGFCGFYKPDIVAYGATQLKDGSVPLDPYSICITYRGFCGLAGTSFTAPTVAGDLAQIMYAATEENVFLAQALLYNGAIPLYDKVNITQEESDLAGNLFGRGLSSPRNSMYSSEDRVSFIHTGKMNRLTKKRVKFYIPTVIANVKVKRGEKKVRVTVTCIAHPPVDRNKGSEYSAAYISASIHRINSNGKNVVDNPTISDNRNRWDTCYHFSNEFSSFESGDWEVWLELFTRWGIKDDEEISYALVITVEDLTEAGNLYSEIVRESAGRFVPVHTVRVPVR